jgi:hypothetical protein
MRVVGLGSWGFLFDVLDDLGEWVDVLEVTAGIKKKFGWCWCGEA